MSLILGLMYYNLNINPIFLLLTGLAGTLTEMIIMYYTIDIWKYRNPDIINIPMWLPILWAIAGCGVLYINKILIDFQISQP